MLSHGQSSSEADSTGINQDLPTWGDYVLYRKLGSFDLGSHGAWLLPGLPNCSKQRLDPQTSSFLLRGYTILHKKELSEPPMYLEQ